MILPKLQMLDIHILGGGLYSYWPLDPTLPVDKEGDLERAVPEYEAAGRDCGGLRRDARHGGPEPV